MNPRIETIEAKKLVGRKEIMSFEDYKVTELWKSFMPRRKEIINPISNDLVSVAIYKATHFTDFRPSNEFEKWAAVEVTGFENVPPGMSQFTIPAGRYAVFAYQGSSANPAVYQYIFNSWLPASAYSLDDRPHFEILGENYRNNDPASEEEIWIPVKARL